MKTLGLSHSDQIVATIAKLPLSVFGSPRTKEVMIVIADHMNKARSWAAWPSVPTIAEKVGCCVRTVRYSLRRLEGINFINTQERKRADDPRMNTSSLYTLGAALRSLCEQLCRVGGKPLQAKTSSLTKTEEQKDPRSTSFVDKCKAAVKAAFTPKPKQKPSKVYGLFDQERANRTPEEWARYVGATRAQREEAAQRNKAKMDAWMGVTA